MEKQVLEIIKQKDDYQNVVEISENAKGETQISVKIRRDGDVKSAGDDAVKEYNRIKGELKK